MSALLDHPTLQSASPKLWLRPWVVFVAVAIGAFASCLLEWRQADINMRAMARERGAALFRLVQLTRDWNARHGGVYVPVTEATPPNPNLQHERRDVVTRDGLALTLVNPAYMTRQIAEIAHLAEGIRLHITSLKPLRPANAADPWEAAALRRFEAGQDEIVELIPGDTPVHRYMAPLKITKPCLTCHEKQGYRLGQIRGGISVTMPAADLLAIRDGERVRAVALHALVFAIVAALLQVLVQRTRRHLQSLEAVAREQDAVIAQRTHALSEANAGLERELANRELAAAVFDNAAEAIVITDEGGRFVEVNPAFSRMTGYAADEVLGKAVSVIKSGRHPPEFYGEMWHTLANENRWQGEVWNRRKNGELFVVWMSIARIPGGVQPARYVATLTDITLRKELEEALRYRAYHDPLTDLPNRALFSDRLRVALLQAQRHGRAFALCFIDLDWFKPVNDRFGHAAGDDLLVETAKRLRLCVRAADTVARIGGDEFAAILTEVGSRTEIEEIAARIVAAIARPFELTAGTARISCSIGIALFPEHGRDVEALQHVADATLYAVKASGRNAFRIAANGADPS
ncbi:MAG: diguanylate cyclase [Sulfuritalea sp.]|nr:diguanylate cyclase [Sulfuritalea sp.]